MHFVISLEAKTQSKKKRQKKKAWGTLVYCCVLLFYLSFLSGSEKNVLWNMMDKVRKKMKGKIFFEVSDVFNVSFFYHKKTISYSSTSTSNLYAPYIRVM